MLDDKTKSLAESFGNFWFQAAGAAAHGLSEAAKLRTQLRTAGKLPDRNEFYRIVARGVRAALEEGEKVAKVVERELEDPPAGK